MKIDAGFGSVLLVVAAMTASTSAQQMIVVTTSADVVDVPESANIEDLPGPDGVVSFREALLASDNTPGHQIVGFQIPEWDWYLPDIYPGQVLLQGSFSFVASEPVTIDGTTQTDYTGDTYPYGNELIIPLQTYLGGDGSVVTGLNDTRVELSGSNCDIYGNTQGMYIVVYFGSGSVIHDNEAWTIKVDQSNDNVIVRNTTSRVRIDGFFGIGAPATNNRIGGPDPADRNFITGWGNHGEHGMPGGTTLELFDTLDTLVENNYIGTTPDGMAIGNNASTVGISIESKNHNLSIRNNLIAIHATDAWGNGHFGQPIYIEAYGGYDGFTRNVEIYGNTLGLNANGEPVLGGLNGITVSRYAQEYCYDVRIGGSEPGQGNVIAGHVSTGVLMTISPGVPPTEGVGIRVSGNSIYGNRDIGIDLTPNTWTFGHTENDPLDADVGANWLQNYPDIVGATNSGQSIHAVGQLSSEPSSDYTLEFFASRGCDPSGFGQGEMYIGSTTVVTDAAGNAPFDVLLPAEVPTGWVITSTATREPIGATSEFSACVPIESSQTAELTGLQVTTGVLLDGTIAELLDSDNARVHTRSGFGSTLVDLHNMEMQITATTTAQSPTLLDIIVESRSDQPAGVEQIGLFNHNTQVWQIVGQHAIGNTDAVNTITDIDATNYVDAQGDMELSVKQMVFVPFLAFTFESWIDHVEIGVR